MRSQPPAAPLHLRPRWSWRLMIYMVLVHLGALVIVAVLPGHWLFRLVLAVLVVVHGFWNFATHGWRRMSWSIMEAIRTQDDWELVLATGEPVPARLLASSFIGQRLMVLNFALGRWRRLSLPLASDSLDAELMRRLRAELRAG